MVTQQCGAKNRQGEPCARARMANGRCYMHGGNTAVGIAAPAFKTGRYSKYLPADLLDRYHTALADPDLLAMHDEIALIDARLGELTGNLKPEMWPEIVALLEQRRKLVESERKRMVDLQQVITAEQALGFVAAVAESVRRHVTDRSVLAAISADIARITGANVQRPPLAG